MAVTNAVTDLVASIGELLSSIFGAAYSIVHSFITGVLGLFAGFISMIGDLVKGVFDLVGGMGRFVAANAVVIALVAAAGYAYVRFVQQPQQQGRKPIGVNGAGIGKKTN
ncbi:hypothetical protein N657DRAFT_583391 [Parathielavia appendiculata]|uniref:Uncharacterized protein n=1 Tax=Parathielavia appendiculata TaxID=2587402 RepID=A0AAN6TQ65_9PEZI|nr:hypothetical protein N657DRAFT_583391 [Parathielavia appendiculata]